MIDYYDGLVTDILPSNLTRDKRARALALALRDLTRLMEDYSKGTLQGDLSNVPEAALDLMAAELRTQHYYSTQLDVPTKKELIKKTPEWHLKAGTPEAVEELLTILYGEGEVIEWFEYNGEPYHFKIRVGSVLRPYMFDDFNKILAKVKNVRSILDSVEVDRNITLSIHSGAARNTAFTKMPRLQIQIPSE